jgi:hypothetical protein
LREVHMPFAGIGLHVVFALICAVHVVRSRQQLYWLFILFAFPFLGSVVYFFAVFLPNSRLERGAMKAVSAAAKALDPKREVREARVAFDDTPTAQNQMRLAAALLEVGDASEAAKEYDACLRGPFAQDKEIRYGAARAYIQCQRYAEGLRHLESLRTEDPEFRAEAVSLQRARGLAGTGRNEEASTEYQAAVARHGTYESKAEYAIWAHLRGDTDTTQRLDEELDKIQSRWTAMARELNDPVARRYKAAREMGRKAG